MAYATTDDLIARFGLRELVQLTDRATPATDQPDLAVAQTALDAAEAMIDGYVGAKYALPLLTTPLLLTDVACDLARYRLFADQATDLVIQRNKEAVETLRRISAGAIKIDAAGVEPDSRGENVVTSGPDRMFTRDSLRRA
jgi:phage gp36-like protein